MEKTFRDQVIERIAQIKALEAERLALYGTYDNPDRIIEIDALIAHLHEMNTITLSVFFCIKDSEVKP